MKLNYLEAGEGKPLIILHGLFGNSDNWWSICRAIEDHFHVYMLDQRNHGQSPHSNEWNYEVMAEDLKEFIEEHQIEDPVILGHSMGGKVAMNFAVDYPHLLHSLIVADIAPKSYSVKHSTILDGLNSLKLDQIGSRKEADQQLAKFVPEFGVRAFLLKNMTRDEENNFKWKINLDVITRDIELVGKGLDRRQQFLKPTLFIRGSRSEYVEDTDLTLIREIFPNAQLETIEGAGHWLHAEKPAEFIEILKRLLD